MVSRRDIMKAAAFGLAAGMLPSALRAAGGGPATALAGKAAEPQRQRPNIVFVFGDQWRASATGYDGDPNVKTPNLDKLADESVNFRTAISVCPICTPNRAALLTGRYPTTTGMFLNDIQLPNEELCIAEVLNQSGYDTAWIGKWHLDGHGRDAYIPPERRQGFDYWKAAECDHNYPRSHYYSGASTTKKLWDGYDAFAQTLDARHYIRDHAAGERPFAMFLSFGPPHYPHEIAPQEFKDLYPPAHLRLRSNVPEARAAAVRIELQGYYAHCTALDQCVGELLAEVDAAGIRENTVFVFTSDHGEMMGAHDIRPFAKQVPWDESARVPLLLRYPIAHGRQGRSITEPINTPDIMPTLLGLAGIPVPGTVEGEDLSAWVRGGRPSDRAALYMSVSPFEPDSDREYRAIRTSRHTYVRGIDGPWLMYDDQADPLQMTNLVGIAQHAQLQKQLDEKLWAELARIGDDFRPGEYYRQKFGFEVNKIGEIPYGKGAKFQSPKRVK